MDTWRSVSCEALVQYTLSREIERKLKKRKEILKICKIYNFELENFSFYSSIWYLNHGFITSTHTFYLPTHVFSLLTHSISLLTPRFEFVKLLDLNMRLLKFKLVTRALLFHDLIFAFVVRNAVLIAISIFWKKNYFDNLPYFFDIFNNFGNKISLKFKTPTYFHVMKKSP